jgi:hypothetical protein
VGESWRRFDKLALAVTYGRNLKRVRYIKIIMDVLKFSQVLNKYIWHNFFVNLAGEMEANLVASPS